MDGKPRCTPYLGRPGVDVRGRIEVRLGRGDRDVAPDQKPPAVVGAEHLAGATLKVLQLVHLTAVESWASRLSSITTRRVSGSLNASGPRPAPRPPYL